MGGKTDENATGWQAVSLPIDLPTSCSLGLHFALGAQDESTLMRPTDCADVNYAWLADLTGC